MTTLQPIRCTLNAFARKKINDRLPLEMIEMILIDAVAAQALRSSATTCVIKKCSCYDDNIASVCGLWRQIVDARRFKEIVTQRVARIDPKALYKQHADRVKIIGVNRVCEIVTMNYKIYTIEYEPNVGPIFSYDMELIEHCSTTKEESSFELVCSNRRPLSTVAALKQAYFLLPSPHENCLFVRTWSALDKLGLFPASPPQVFKIADDGTVSVHWLLDPELYTGDMAIDSLGHRLIVSCKYFPHVFTSMGLHIATITFPQDSFPPFCKYTTLGEIRILPDSTVVVNIRGYFSYFGTDCSSQQKNLRAMTPEGRLKSQDLQEAVNYSSKLVKLRSTTTPEGRLQYQDLQEAVDSGSFSVTSLDDDDSDGFFIDSEGCTIAMLEDEFVVTDTKMETIMAAKHKREKYSFRYAFHFDQYHGLLFFIEGMETQRELCALHVRHGLACQTPVKAKLV